MFVCCARQGLLLACSFAEGEMIYCEDSEGHTLGPSLAQAPSMVLGGALETCWHSHMFSKNYKVEYFSFLIHTELSSEAHRVCVHLGEVGLDGYSDIDAAPNQLYHLRQMAFSLSLTLLYTEPICPIQLYRGTQSITLQHSDGEFWNVSINHCFT